MKDFIYRLKQEDIIKFFDGINKIQGMKKSYNKNMLDIIFTNENGKVCWYSIANNYICAPGINKTSEDWKFYMSEIFGDAYLQEYAETPITNSFVSGLTLAEIKKFLEMGNVKIENVKEFKAFRKGTRRFKLHFLNAPHTEHEVVIGPHYDYSSGLLGITEYKFNDFFAKRFGKDFVSFYCDVEKKKNDEKVENYRLKCEKQLKEKRDKMISLWQSNLIKAPNKQE